MVKHTLKVMCSHRKDAGPFCHMHEQVKCYFGTIAGGFHHLNPPSPGVFCNKGVLKNFANLTGK